MCAWLGRESGEVREKGGRDEFLRGSVVFEEGEF